MYVSFLYVFVKRSFKCLCIRERDLFAIVDYVVFPADPVDIALPAKNKGLVEGPALGRLLVGREKIMSFLSYTFNLNV